MTTAPDFTCPNGHRIPERRFDTVIGCVVVTCTYRRPGSLWEADGRAESVVDEVEDAPEPVIDREGVTVAVGRIRGIIGRIEALIGQREEINGEIRDIKANAKQDGFNVKAIAELIRRRAMDPDVRQQLDDDLSLYEAVVGLAAGTIDGGVLTTAALPPPEAEPRLGKASRARRDAMATASLAAQAREAMR